MKGEEEERVRNEKRKRKLTQTECNGKECKKEVWRKSGK